MALPRIDQYQLAVQNPAIAFSDPELRAARTATTPMQLPKVASGGFALAYQLVNGSHRWAVRCFHKEASDLPRRYAAISARIRVSRSDIFVPVEYQGKGIQVGGSWYPITKMEWLNAAGLGHYVESHLASENLKQLEGAFVRSTKCLESMRVAHGNLQHGNVLVDNHGELRLIDYDGMFVPGLEGISSNEVGHPNYQHPRRSAQFDPSLDRFSILVIVTALKALAARPDLWVKYSNGDNILFRQSDFVDPDSSPLFHELFGIPSVGELAKRLQRICRADYTSIPSLDEYLTGAFTLTAPATAVPAAPAARRGFDIVDATMRAKLLALEGEVVTIVGRIVEIHQDHTRYGKPYAFVNFGDWRTGNFALVLWSDVIKQLESGGQSLNSYQGMWVSLTGLVTVYRTGRSTRADQPQIVVEDWRDIQVLSGGKAKDLLAGRSLPSPKESPGVNGKNGSGKPVSRSDADILNRLYASGSGPVEPTN